MMITIDKQLKSNAKRGNRASDSEMNVQTCQQNTNTP